MLSLCPLSHERHPLERLEGLGFKVRNANYIIYVGACKIIRCWSQELYLLKKLSMEYVHLTSYSRMRVNLAAQVNSYFHGKFAFAIRLIPCIILGVK